MPVRAADDEGQRDSTRVDQQTALASFFFPCPRDWGPRIRSPAAPCPALRQCFATSMPPLPAHRIRPSPAARSREKIPPPANGQTGHAPNWSCHIPWARPSTDTRCAARKPSRQKPACPASAFCRHRPCACIYASRSALSAARKAQDAPRAHRRLPMTLVGPFTHVSQGGIRFNFIYGQALKPASYWYQLRQKAKPGLERGPGFLFGRPAAREAARSQNSPMGARPADLPRVSARNGKPPPRVGRKFDQER